MFYGFDLYLRIESLNLESDHCMIVGYCIVLKESCTWMQRIAVTSALCI